jgi:transcriptional regulator GlxA family with amidase domain
VSILLYELVMSLYRSQVEKSRERDCSVVTWNWIHHRFDQPFNMNELAGRLGVSREHLSRKFQQTYGESPAEMLRSLRLERGSVLTLTTRLPLEDLARQSGYRDGNIFCRTYRNKFGTSPMQDRRCNE